MNIVVTITRCVQIGENEFKDVSISKVFNCDLPLTEMMSWARAYLHENITINDLKFSEHDDT